MRSRRFAPLFWCQFFSAFNDNFVRQMLAMLILFRFGAEDAGAKVSLAVAIFVLPSIPLSPLGGEIADAHDKAAVARRLKSLEIFVQLVAAAGFYFSSLELLYAALFGLGCISALFGPIKYGILPDHLKAGGAGLRQRARRGRDIRRDHLRSRRRRLRGGARARPLDGRRPARGRRGGVLRRVLVHSGDRRRRAEPQGRLHSGRRRVRSFANSRPTIVSGSARSR